MDYGYLRFYNVCVEALEYACAPAKPLITLKLLDSWSLLSFVS